MTNRRIALAVGTYMLDTAYVTSGIVSVTLGDAWALNLFRALVLLYVALGTMIIFVTLFAGQKIIEDRVKNILDGKGSWVHTDYTSMAIDCVAIICSGILGWYFLTVMLFFIAGNEQYIREKVSDGVMEAEKRVQQSTPQ